MSEVEVKSVRSEILAKKIAIKKKKHSDAGKKAWDTIRKNEKRSEASRKAWETRRARQEKTKPSQEPLTIVSPPLPLTEAEGKRKRSEASKKAWETRRANEKQKKVRQKQSEELIGALEYEGHYHHFSVDRNGNIVMPRNRKNIYEILDYAGSIYYRENGGD